MSIKLNRQRPVRALPSGARGVILNYANPAVSVIMPSTKRDITFHGPSGYEHYPDTELPDFCLSYRPPEIHGARESNWRMHVFKDGKVAIWRGGNVWDDARVCWGRGNPVPRDPRQAWTIFWEAAFNADLIDVPANWGQSQEEYVAENMPDHTPLPRLIQGRLWGTSFDHACENIPELKAWRTWCEKQAARYKAVARKLRVKLPPRAFVHSTEKWQSLYRKYAERVPHPMGYNDYVYRMTAATGRGKAERRVARIEAKALTWTNKVQHLWHAFNELHNLWHPWYQYVCRHFAEGGCDPLTPSRYDFDAWAFNRNRIRDFIDGMGCEQSKVMLRPLVRRMNTQARHYFRAKASDDWLESQAAQLRRQWANGRRLRYASSLWSEGLWRKTLDFYRPSKVFGARFDELPAAHFLLLAMSTEPMTKGLTSLLVDRNVQPQHRGPETVPEITGYNCYECGSSETTVDEYDPGDYDMDPYDRVWCHACETWSDIDACTPRRSGKGPTGNIWMGVGWRLEDDSVISLMHGRYYRGVWMNENDAVPHMVWGEIDMTQDEPKKEGPRECESVVSTSSGAAGRAVTSSLRSLEF